MGWRPDPHGRFPFRWWDGERWTGSVVGDDNRVQWDPVEDEDADRDRPADRPPLPGLGAAVAGFAAAIGLSVLARLALSWAGDPGGRLAELLVASGGLWAGLTGACFYVSRRRGTGSLVRDFGLSFRWRDLGFGLAGSLVGRALAIAAIAPLAPLLPTRQVGEGERVVFEDALDRGFELAILTLVICVGAPFFEELFFRGLIQGRLQERLGVGPAIALASVLFGAAHLTAWQGGWTFAYAGAVAAGGVVLGLMFHVSGRLGPPMLAHAFFNGQVVVLVALLRS